MSETEIILKLIKQIFMLCMLGLTGYFVGKKKIVIENTGVVLSRVVIKLTAPILIFMTLASYNFTKKEIVDGVSIYISGIIFIVLAFFISKIVSNKLRLSDVTKNVYQMQSMFGNVIFLAYPILTALYGEKGIVYGVFFNIASDTILWTLGVYLVNKHNTGDSKSNLSHLINPNTIAFTAGILVVVIKYYFGAFINNYEWIKVTGSFLYDTYQPLGKTTIYLSMIFIGLILSETKLDSFKRILKMYPSFLIGISKLLVVPIIAYFVLGLLGNRIDAFAKTIVVLQLAMPCATIVTALAAEYDADYKFATESVFVTTLMSIITLPIIVYIIT